MQVSVLFLENHSDGYPENIQLFRYYTLSLVQSTFDIRMDRLFEWMLPLDDYNIQLTIRILKPRIEAALD